VKTCVEFVFEIFGSSWYNTWTIVLISCLWLVPSVDTTQAHIYYSYSHQNLSQVKFLANLLAGLRGSGNSGKFPGGSGFPGNSGLSPRLTHSFTFYRVVYPPPHSRRLPSLPHIAPRQFSPPLSKSSESEGLRAPRCGDRRSTPVSKD
jgi:hypothetical protein